MHKNAYLNINKYTYSRVIITGRVRQVYHCSQVGDRTQKSLNVPSVKKSKCVIVSLTDDVTAPDFPKVNMCVFIA